MLYCISYFFLLLEEWIVFKYIYVITNISKCILFSFLFYINFYYILYYINIVLIRYIFNIFISLLAKYSNEKYFCTCSVIILCYNRNYIFNLDYLF